MRRRAPSRRKPQEPRARAILRRLADVNVPMSMALALTGRTMEQLEAGDGVLELVTLWALAEAYDDVYARRRACWVSLADAVTAAAVVGVLYEPPCAVQVMVAARKKTPRPP